MPRRSTLPVLKLLLVAACMTPLGGCLVVESTRTAPATPLSVLKVGSTSADAARLLGEPLRTWRPNDDVVYRLYPYKRPLKGDYAAAGGCILMDAITLGMFELLMPIDDKNNELHREQSVARVWISFDAKDHLLGVFAEMDVLPADGLPIRHAPAPEAHP